MSTLYYYQEESIAKIREGWKSHKRQVLALPTGAGKTYTFSYMAKLADDKGKTVMILTHRTELFGQTYKTFTNIGLKPYIINAESKDPENLTGVFVVMVETLARRQELISKIKPDLIIIDEAHIGNFNKIIDLFPDVYVLGVTATVVGKHFVKYYTNIVQTIDTPDLIREGFLMPYKAYQMADDFSDLKKGKDGDFSTSSQFDHFNKSKLYDGVIEEWKKRCEGKQTLVFNCSIKHSDEMAQRFNDAGIESYSITSKTPEKERKEILRRFHNGEFLVLNNNSIFSAGYDHPPIEGIVLNRATDSLALYMQMNGRGSRKSPGKDGFICLDFGGNHTRHGMWSQPREWSLDEKKKNKKGEAIVKECPKCQAMLFGSAKECMYCGYIFPMLVKDLRTGIMQEYFECDVPKKPIKECTPSEIALLVKLEKFERKKAVAIVRRRGYNDLMEFAKSMGYSYGWASTQLKMIKKYGKQD